MISHSISHSMPTIVCCFVIASVIVLVTVLVLVLLFHGRQVSARQGRKSNKGFKRQASNLRQGSEDPVVKGQFSFGSCTSA